MLTKQTHKRILIIMKTCKILLFAFFVLFTKLALYSQVGASCDSAVFISNLPFSQNNLNTADGADVFTSDMVCSSSFMNGNEYVFKISSSVLKVIAISLSSTSQNTGLFVVNGCPLSLHSYCVAKSEALLGNPSLNNVFIYPDSVYYIIVSTRTTSVAGITMNQTTSFNILINEVNPNDMQVLEIVEPNTDCQLSNAEQIKVRIKNNGLVNSQSMQISYRINGGIVSSEDFSMVLSPGSEYVYTFSTSADLSGFGLHQVSTWVSMTNDANHQNDTLIKTVRNSPLISTYPHLQNFETNHGYWYKSPANVSWAHGIPLGSNINTAASGFQAWVTNLTGNNNSNETAYLNSPCYNLSSLAMPIVKLKINRRMTTGQSAQLQYSINNGVSWINMGSQSANWYNQSSSWNGNSNGIWETKFLKVPDIAHQGHVLFRLVFNSNILTSEGLGFDDFEIFNAPANDIGISEILTPNNSCGMTNEVISVRVVNHGSAAQSNFQIGYSLNGSNYIYETFQGILGVNSSQIYSFSPVDFSVLGNYNVSVRTHLTNDADTINDLYNKQIVHTDGVSVFPYHADFENGQADWQIGGTHPSWELGMPNGAFVYGTTSGTNAWATSLDSTHNAGENSWIESPCFNLSDLNMPVIEMNVNYRTTPEGINPSSLATVYIQFSLDNGQSWTILGSNNDSINWYNSFGVTGWTGRSEGWVNARRRCPELVGASQVKFRIRFDASSTSLLERLEGMAFDDFKIYDMPARDVAIISFVGPKDECNMGMEHIAVRIINYGYEPQFNIPISYQINNGQVVEAVVYSQMNYAQNRLFTFPFPSDFSNHQTHEVKVFLQSNIDENRYNDTLYVAIVNSSLVDTFPYFENFSTMNHRWTPGGYYSSWEKGVPVNQGIMPQSSGNSCMITNASGNHLPNEDSWVMSPCYDFSNMDRPYVKFKLNYHINYAYSQILTYLEASTDEGNNWYRIGNAGDETNWYNSQGIVSLITGQGWIGYTGGWITAIHALENTANQSVVKLRFRMKSNVQIPPIGSETSGFAFDDFQILNCENPNLNFQVNFNGRTATFALSPEPNTTYLWHFGDGDTSTLISPSHTYINNGYYNVKLVAKSECTVDSVVQIINVGSVNVLENQHRINVLCFPNPNNGRFVLQTNSYHGNLKVHIFNPLGQKVLTSQVKIKQDDEMFFDISEYGKGVYYLYVEVENQVIVRKVVVR